MKFILEILDSHIFDNDDHYQFVLENTMGFPYNYTKA
jgi:hypothetical protein